MQVVISGSDGDSGFGDDLLGPGHGVEVELGDEVFF